MAEVDDNPTVSGSVPFGSGLGALVRIPIPGTSGLAIELRPRGHVPKGGSTSTLFFQNIAGNRHLRLDYGYNVATKTIDYHWNQKGVNSTFGITNHQTTNNIGATAYRGAKYYKYLGRTLIVAGVVIDGYSIVTASKPIQRATEVVSAWAGAWAGCKVVGAGGAWGGGAAGTAVPIVGNAAGAAIGGIGGCIIGGIGGYKVGEHAGRTVYMWTEDTIFNPLPQANSWAR